MTRERRPARRRTPNPISKRNSTRLIEARQAIADHRETTQASSPSLFDAQDDRNEAIAQP